MPPSLPAALRHPVATRALGELELGEAPRPRSNAPMAAPGEPALAPSQRGAPRPTYPM